MSGWLQIGVLLVLLTALTPVLGGYIDRVFSGERVLLRRLLGRLARSLVRLLAGADPAPQEWREYAISVLIFSAVCLLALYLTLQTQSLQPFAPLGLRSPPFSLAVNVAASFVTNTPWEYYGGNTLLSNLSQMAGITVHSFLSGAVGLAVAVAVTRGFAGRSGRALRNFWADLIGGLLYVLLPLSMLMALVLAAQGAVQTLSDELHLSTLLGGHRRWRSARWHPRSRSTCSARTAAGSTGWARRCRSRTRAGSRTSCRH